MIKRNQFNADAFKVIRDRTKRWSIKSLLLYRLCHVLDSDITLVSTKIVYMLRACMRVTENWVWSWFRKWLMGHWWRRLTFYLYICSDSPLLHLNLIEENTFSINITPLSAIPSALQHIHHFFFSFGVLCPSSCTLISYTYKTVYFFPAFCIIIYTGNIKYLFRPTVHIC